MGRSGSALGKRAAAGLALALVLAGLGWLGAGRPADTRPATPLPDSMARPGDAAEPNASASSSSPSPPPSTAVASGSAPMAASAPPDDPLQRFTRLSTSDRPQDRVAAHAMLRDCQAAEWALGAAMALPRDEQGRALFDRLAPPARARLQAPDCQRLPHGQTPVRLGLLESAAAQGHVGAAHALWQEGPNGQPYDLWQRPDDLLVRQWVARQLARLHRHAAAGDLETAHLLAQLHDPQTGAAPTRDAYRAALYQALALALRERAAGTDAPRLGRWRRQTGAQLAALPADQRQALQDELSHLLSALPAAQAASAMPTMPATPESPRP